MRISITNSLVIQMRPAIPETAALQVKVCAQIA